MTNKGICFACGKEYDICPNCPGNEHGFVPWRRMYCSIDHFKLFELIREYKNGKISKEEVIQQLSSIKHDGFEDFNTATGRTLREILSESAAPAEEQPKPVREKRAKILPPKDLL